MHTMLAGMLQMLLLPEHRIDFGAIV